MRHDTKYAWVNVSAPARAFSSIKWREKRIYIIGKPNLIFALNEMNEWQRVQTVRVYRERYVHCTLHSDILAIDEQSVLCKCKRVNWPRWTSDWFTVRVERINSFILNDINSLLCIAHIELWCTTVCGLTTYCAHTLCMRRRMMKLVRVSHAIWNMFYSPSVVGVRLSFSYRFVSRLAHMRFNRILVAWIPWNMFAFFRPNKTLLVWCHCWWWWWWCFVVILTKLFWCRKKCNYHVVSPNLRLRNRMPCSGSLVICYNWANDETAKRNISSSDCVVIWNHFTLNPEEKQRKERWKAARERVKKRFHFFFRLQFSS